MTFGQHVFINLALNYKQSPNEDIIPASVLESIDYTTGNEATLNRCHFCWN